MRYRSIPSILEAVRTTYSKELLRTSIYLLITSVKYLADQPYESSKGLSFECKYNENIPWKISGSIHKEDTFEGGNAYFVNINIIRYVEI